MLLPGLDHRPACLVFPCGQLPSRHSKRMAQHVVTTPVTTHRLPADQTSHRLDATRELLFKLSMFKLSWRPESCFGANGQPGSRAIGNILMLLMKWSTTQGGNAFSFPHLGITKVGQNLPRLTSVFRGIPISRR